MIRQTSCRRAWRGPRPRSRVAARTCASGATGSWQVGARALAREEWPPETRDGPGPGVRRTPHDPANELSEGLAGATAQVASSGEDVRERADGLVAARAADFAP